MVGGLKLDKDRFKTYLYQTYKVDSTKKLNVDQFMEIMKLLTELKKGAEGDENFASTLSLFTSHLATLEPAKEKK
jgi:hypothetical protein